jgi:transcriptional regulator with XRE-family HTH domain
MVERIKSIMEHYGLKSAQFADAIGMQRSAVSHVLLGRNRPSLDFVLRIKNKFGEINLDWLLLGKGKMIAQASDAPAADTIDLFKGGDSASVAGAESRSVIEPDVNADEQSPSQMKTKRAPEVSDEMPEAYGYSVSREQPVQVVFLYRDGTFRIYHSKK